MTTQAVDDELVAEVARDLVAKTAPHELPLFRATSEEYFKDPERALSPPEAKDETLGFGVGIALAMITPVALEVVKSVIAFVSAEVGKTAKEESEPLIRNAVRRLFRRGKDPAEASGPQPATIGLNEEQLAEVRRVALEKAEQLKLAKDKAELLADALVGELATGPTY